jgi:GTP cyclohydrolase I
VAVVMEGWHLCATMRGVKKAHAVMVTSALIGSFKESDSTRQEFFDHLQRETLQMSI